MRRILTIFGVLVGVALGYMVATGGLLDAEKQISRDVAGAFSSDEDVGDHVAKEYDQLVADAKRENPDMPTSVAAQERARSVGAEQLESASSTLERNMMAASQFWGFLYVNTRARPIYCESVGVDISPFVDAFEAAHAREAEVAARLFDEQNIPRDELWAELEATLVKAVRQDMLDIENMHSLSPSEACQVFAQKPDDLVKNMMLQDKSPATYKVLIDLANTP